MVYYIIYITGCFWITVPNMFIGMSFGKAHVPWWATWILFIYILFHIIVEITLEIHQCCTHKKNKGTIVVSLSNYVNTCNKN